MLRWIFSAFRSKRLKEIRYFPASSDLPSLWPESGRDRREANLKVLYDAPTDILMQLCDQWWDYYLADDDYPQIIFRDSCVHRRALEILAERGNQCLAWARARLKHQDYDARADAAYLIMKFAQSRQLGSEEAAVAEELTALALRTPEKDSKEALAACAALGALSVIGGSACMKAVRAVLNSPDWDQDDNQWEAAVILAEMTGQSFMEAADPVAAAKKWVNANPNNET